MWIYFEGEKVSSLIVYGYMVYGVHVDFCEYLQVQW